jgi:hypothetical protein
VFFAQERPASDASAPPHLSIHPHASHHNGRLAPTRRTSPIRPAGHLPQGVPAAPRLTPQIRAVDPALSICGEVDLLTRRAEEIANAPDAAHGRPRDCRPQRAALGATSRHLAATPHPSYLTVNFQQIDVDTDGRARLDAAAMDLCHNDFLCPVCSKPMRLLTTIRRMPGEQTLVLQCRPCGLSTTKTVEGPGPRDTTH